MSHSIAVDKKQNGCEEQSRPRTLAILLVLLFCLLQLLPHVSALASQESELVCFPTEVEPNENVQCVINVRNAQREPTMSFNVDDFSVSVVASTPEAVVTVSPLARGVDITTVAFTIRASVGTELRVYGAFDPVSSPAQPSPSAGKGPLRNSGLKVSVLTWPAVALGPITCDDEISSNGLTLRDATTCTAALVDGDGKPAVIHSSDVTFAESNLLGSFHFLAGKRELRFKFLAPATVSVAVTKFTLHVSLGGSHHSRARQLSFPLKYPALPPVASRTYLRCADEIKPIVCTIAAADTIGPVLFNASYLEMGMQTPGTGVNGEWYANEEDFIFRYTDPSSPSLDSSDSHHNNNVNNNDAGLVGNAARPDLGLVTWSLRVNNAIQRQRFSVHVRRVDHDGTTAREEIVGSPFGFLSGVVPTAASVTLRGCNITAVRATRNATCYADLSNGVSGDVDFFTFSSEHGGNFSNKTYVAQDPVTRARSVTVIYTAPSVKVRTDDFIAVHVKGSGEAINSPFRMNVFPILDSNGGGGGNGSDASDTAAIVGVGLSFYGCVLLAGLVLVVRRSRTIRRIRHERAAKQAWLEEEMQEQEREAAAAAAGTTRDGPDGDANEVSEDLARDTSDPTIGSYGNDAHAPAAGSRGHRASTSAATTTSRQPSRQTSSVFVGATRPSQSTAVAQASVQRGVVSNAPVDQLRMHSDSD